MAVRQYPVIITVRDRLSCLQQLLKWLENIGQNEIWLCDNDSTYPPLVEFLKNTKHNVIYNKFNLGHRAPWLSGLVPQLGNERYFIISDPMLFLMRIHQVMSLRCLSICCIQTQQSTRSDSRFELMTCLITSPTSLMSSLGKPNFGKMSFGQAFIKHRSIRLSLCIDPAADTRMATHCEVARRTRQNICRGIKILPISQKKTVTTFNTAIT